MTHQDVQRPMPRQMRPLEERLRDPNPDVRAQAQRELQARRDQMAQQVALADADNAQASNENRRLGDSETRWADNAQARNDALQNQAGGGLTPGTYNARLGDYVTAQSAARNHPDAPWPVQMAAPWVNPFVDPVQPRNLPETQGALGIIGRALNGNPLEDIARGLDSLGAVDDPEFAARHERGVAAHKAITAPIGYDAPDENIVVHGRPIGVAQRARNVGRRIGQAAVNTAQAFDRGMRDLNERHPDQRGDIVGLIGAEASDMLNSGPRSYEAHAQERDRARFEGRSEDASRAQLAGLGDAILTAGNFEQPARALGGAVRAIPRALDAIGEVGIRTSPEAAAAIAERNRVLQAHPVPEGAQPLQQPAGRRLGQPIDAEFTPAPNAQGAVQAQQVTPPEAPAPITLSPEAIAAGGDTANTSGVRMGRPPPQTRGIFAEGPPDGIPPQAGQRLGAPQSDAGGAGDGREPLRITRDADGIERDQYGRRHYLDPIQQTQEQIRERMTRENAVARDRMLQREATGGSTATYEPSRGVEMTIGHDGNIAFNYMDRVRPGEGSGQEAQQVFRGVYRALQEDIAANGRAEYSWKPETERLGALYRRAMTARAPEGYVFSEASDGTMRLARRTPPQSDGGARLPRQVMDAGALSGSPFEMVRNPSEADVARLMRQSSRNSQRPELRYVRDASGNVYIGEARSTTHQAMAGEAGFDVRGDGNTDGFIVDLGDGPVFLEKEQSRNQARPLRELLRPTPQPPARSSGAPRPYRGTVFHGSPSAVEGPWRPNTFFAAQRNKADIYAYDAGTGGPGIVHETQVELRNPYRLVSDEMTPEGKILEIGDPAQVAALADRLKAQGYDGVVVQTASEDTPRNIVEVLAFDPEDAVARARRTNPPSNGGPSAGEQLAPRRLGGRPDDPEGIFGGTPDGLPRQGRRLGQVDAQTSNPDINPAPEPGANAARTEADILARLPTNPEQWRSAIGLHPWINSPSRAQLVIMSNARDASGRFIYSTDDILNATGISSPQSLRVLTSNARQNGIPLLSRNRGANSATGAAGGDRAARALDILERVHRAGQQITTQDLAARMGLKPDNVSVLLSQIRQGSNPSRTVPEEMRARFLALDRAGVIQNGRGGRVRIKPDAAGGLGVLALGGLGAGAAALSGQDAQAQEDSAQSAQSVQDVPGAPGVRIDTNDVASPSMATARGAPQVIAGTPYFRMDFANGSAYLYQMDRSDPRRPVPRIVGRIVMRSGDMPNDVNYGRSRGSHDPVGADDPNQMDSGEALARQNQPGTPAWAFAVPLITGFLGGRIGARYLGERSAQPLLGRALGSAIGGATGGAAAGSVTEAPDMGTLAGIGALEGPAASFGGEAAIEQAPRLGRALSDASRNVLRNSRRLEVAPPPINPPRFASLDEGELADEMRRGGFFDPKTGRPVFGAATRQRAPLPRLEDRAAVNGARGALQGVRVGKLREIAGDLGIETEGRSAADIRQAVLQHLARDPQFDRTSDLVAFLRRYGIVGLALGAGIGASVAANQTSARASPNSPSAPSPQLRARRLGSHELQAAQ